MYCKLVDKIRTIDNEIYNNHDLQREPNAWPELYWPVRNQLWQQLNGHIQKEIHNFIRFCKIVT